MNYDLTTGQTAASSGTLQQSQNNVINGSSLWNQAWNTGYNQASSSTNPYAGQNVSGYDIGAGYIQGQKQYLADLAKKQTYSAPTGQVTGNPITPSASTVPDYGSFLPSQSEIDSAFNINKNYLDSQLSSLNAYEPVQQQQLTDQYNLSGQKIADTQQQGLGQIDLQRTQLDRAKTSAVAQAAQIFRELTQQFQNKYGGNGSAAQGFSAILGKQTARNIGSANNQFIDGNQALSLATNKVNDLYSQTKNQIELQFNQQIADNKQKYNQSREEIRYQNFKNEADRSASQLENLRSAREAAFNFLEQKRAYDQQLEVMKNGLSAYATQSASQIKGQVPAQDFINSLDESIRKISQGIPTLSGNQTPAAQDQISMQQGIYNPAAKDPNSDLFNLGAYA